MIALFDSGVGGLSILIEIQRLLPGESTVYLADTANFPYGQKSEDQVRNIALGAADVLMKYAPTALVVACNTASTVALPALRQRYPSLPIVGVVPALKPAVAATKSGTIALLATERTLGSEAYRQLKQEFASGRTIIDQPCPGWVELVETGHVSDEQAKTAVEAVIEPLQARGADTYVLGCTHYPFLSPLIQRAAGREATILDSGQAVAEQLQRVLPPSGSSSKNRKEYYLTSGTEDNLSTLAGELIGHRVDVTLL